MRSPLEGRYFVGMRYVLATVCVSIATVLVSGCTSGSSTDHHRVTKQAYVAQADAICARIDRADKAIPTDTPPADVLRKTANAFGGAVSDLKALDRPAGHDRELDAWFTALDHEAAALARMQQVADSGDKAGLMRPFASGEPLERRIQRAARRFGFHDCAR